VVDLLGKCHSDRRQSLLVDHHEGVKRGAVERWYMRNIPDSDLRLMRDEVNQG
jgi:hypothetical protein